MKITLNTSIPENRRSEIAAAVQEHVGASEIVWLPSRFPRYVMLIEPGLDNRSEVQRDSMFDSPEPGTQSLSSMTEALETRIKACLSLQPGV